MNVMYHKYGLLENSLLKILLNTCNAKVGICYCDKSAT